MAHVRKIHSGRLNRPHQRKQLQFARNFQFVFQLVGGVKVVFNRAFAAARDEDHMPNTCGVSLFYCVLNQWLVDHWQHLFGLRFGGW